MSCHYTNERNLLRFSSFSCFCFAAFGIGVGIWAGSMIIVFDGAYSLISLFLSLIALIASSYIQKLLLKNQHIEHSVDNRKAAVIESLVVLIKGLALSIVFITSFISASRSMFDGGREVNADFALLFGVVNVLGCLYTYLLLKKQLGLYPSVILKAESNQWLLDTIISAAVLLGFIITSVLMMAGFAEYAVYADPLMVILASVYFISLPVKMIRESIHNLLLLYQNRTYALRV